jgi:hypothetical protein
MITLTKKAANEINEKIGDGKTDFADLDDWIDRDFCDHEWSSSKPQN